MSEPIYLSEEKYKELKERLDYLKKVRRKELAQRIAEAREKGDLSENADYHAAREALAQTEEEIARLEIMLSTAKIIKAQAEKKDKVYLYSFVEVENLKLNRRFNWQIVGEKEGDIANNKIPVSSPVGKMLLGKKEGDIVEVETPSGKVQYKILKIS